MHRLHAAMCPARPLRFLVCACGGPEGSEAVRYVRACCLHPVGTGGSRGVLLRQCCMKTVVVLGPTTTASGTLCRWVWQHRVQVNVLLPVSATKTAAGWRIHRARHGHSPAWSAGAIVEGHCPAPSHTHPLHACDWASLLGCMRQGHCTQVPSDARRSPRCHPHLPVPVYLPQCLIAPSPMCDPAR